MKASGQELARRVRRRARCNRARDRFAVERDFMRREIRVDARADAQLFQEILIGHFKLECRAIRIYLGGDDAGRRINRCDRTTWGLRSARPRQTPRITKATMQLVS